MEIHGESWNVIMMRAFNGNTEIVEILFLCGKTRKMNHIVTVMRVAGFLSQSR